MKAALRTTFLLAAVTAAAADCRKVEGPFILARDLAAVAPAFAAAPQDAVFGPAPRPGVERVATVEQLDRFARSHGIAPSFESFCFVRVATPPDPQSAAAAMRASLRSAEARIEIVEMSRFPAPPGAMVFPRESLAEPPAGGGAAVWNGYVAYDGGRFPIWAKARIAVPLTRVVAAAPLRAGQILTDADIKVETAEDFPRRTAPLASPAEAVGRVARRAIPAGAPIPASALAEANAVERGQTVAVEVRSGGAVLKLEARAEAAGRRGDVIPVRNIASQKLFRARVEDKGRVAVECRGPEVSK